MRSMEDKQPTWQQSWEDSTSKSAQVAQIRRDHTSERHHSIMVAWHEVLHWSAQLLWQQLLLQRHYFACLMQAKNHSNKLLSAEEWQLKNILNSLSHIHCDCKCFYNYIPLSVFGQMHYWHNVYFLINWVHFPGKKKLSLGRYREHSARLQ